MKTYKTPKIKVIVIEDSLLMDASQSEGQESTQPYLDYSPTTIDASDARSKQYTGLFDDSDDENYAD